MLHSFFSLLSLLSIPWSGVDRNTDLSLVYSAPLVFAADAQSIVRVSSLPHSQDRPVQKIIPKTLPPAVVAKSVLIIDDLTQTSLFEQNADAIIPIASLTKLATVLTVTNIEGFSFDTKIVIEEQDIIEDRSALAVGDVVTLRDLISLALIGSSNSAAHTLVRASGLSLEYFVGRMNRQALELGLSRTFFVEPTGLDPRNVGTAHDVYLLLKAVSSDAELGPIIGKNEYTFWNGSIKKKVFSTNIFKLGILSFGGKTIIGAKTGHIVEAGFHFAAQAVDINNRVWFVIVLGAPDHFSRFTDADALIKWAQTSL